jgi:HEAT repeat protein
VARDFLPRENDLGTDELFDAVLDDLREDDDTRLGSLIALAGRPTRSVVDRCLAMCRSSDPHERTVGLRVLRELKHQLVEDKLLWDPIEPILLEMISTESDPDVLQWVILCIGNHTPGPAALPAVLQHVDHEDEWVRYAVAASLPCVADHEHPQTEAIDALLRLSEDADADVRAYALMGLVMDLGLAAEIRATLEAHLEDPDEKIRRYVTEELEVLDG